MELKIKIFFGAALFCLIICLASCSSSTLVDVWNDPAYNEPPLKNILIIAFRKDPIQRRIWEDAFANEFAKHGVRATSSYILFQNSFPDTLQIIEAVQENKFDGMLVTRLLNEETQTRYIESYVTSELRTRYNPFRKTYTNYYQEIHHPGYVESKTIERRSIEVWLIENNERIIWGATSNTPERNTVEDVQNDVAKLVIPELMRNEIVKYIK